MGKLAGEVSQDRQLANQRWLMIAGLNNNETGPIPHSTFLDDDGETWQVSGSVVEEWTLLKLRREAVINMKGFEVILSEVVETTVDASTTIVNGNHRFSLEASASLSFMKDPYLDPRIQTQPGLRAPTESGFVTIEGIEVPNCSNTEKSQPQLITDWFSTLPHIVRGARASRPAAP